jgi:hypothetical protein
VTTPPTPRTSGRRFSIQVYRAILRLYPHAFQDPWAEEAALLFAELSRRQPTMTLWTDNLPDLVRGLLAEWWRELVRLPRDWRHTLGFGVAAGVLLSTATAAGNLGHLWSTPAGHVTSWLISVTALTVLAMTGRSRPVRHALRNGFFSGLLAFTLTNLTATVIVLACFDHLSHDPLQIAAFTASHEPDFRTYQTHDLLGGWFYGTAAGALLGTLGSAAGAIVSRIRFGGSRRPTGG